MKKIYSKPEIEEIEFVMNEDIANLDEIETSVGLGDVAPEE